MLTISRRPFHTLFSYNRFLMSSKNLLKCARCTLHHPFPSRHHHLHAFPRLFFSNPERLNTKFRHSSIKGSSLCSFQPLMLSRTVHLPRLEDETVDAGRLAMLKMKLEKEGILCGSCTPGQYSHMLCPQCQGGDSKEKSFSLFIREDGELAMWSCFRAKCGWRGHMRASIDGRGYNNFEKNSKIKPVRVLTEDSLELQPLCGELLAYFAERMISGETLRRNAVVQRRHCGDQIVIAFTYRRNGKLVSCKYRDINKKFWQEKDTEKILYGLDDIKEASDVIIVEGEMDKLSLEEAGFRNCVSVPDGAPSKVSNKNLPDKEEVLLSYYLSS